MQIVVTFPVKKIIKFLALTIVFLSLMSVTLSIIVYGNFNDSALINRMLDFFYLDYERNLPTWFSTLLLALNSVFLLLIAYRTRLMEQEHTWYWAILGVLFLAFSIDEFAQIHELLIVPLQTLFNTSGFLYFAWIIPGAIFVVILGLLYIPFFLKLPPHIRNMIFLAGMIYISGTLFMEAIGGQHYAMLSTVQNEVQHDLKYAIIVNVEEILEMSGLLLFFYALNLYVVKYVSHLDKPKS